MVTPAVAFEVVECTIASTHAALRAGTISSVGLVEAYLRRIGAYNGMAVHMPTGYLGSAVPIADCGQLNALCTLNLRPAARQAWGFDARKARSLTDLDDGATDMPDALEAAAALDRAWRETGKLVGPLHGVVFAVKDQFDTRDMRTTGGAATLWANDRPPCDASLVTRLRKAGAVILAKANMGEFASGVPRSSFGGVFANPYDTLRSPSGSSSGSGSAVAANLVCCAIGGESGKKTHNSASIVRFPGPAEYV